MEATEIKVTGCLLCPFRTFTFCKIWHDVPLIVLNEADVLANKPPDNCPLKTQTITVKLEEK